MASDEITGDRPNSRSRFFRELNSMWSDAVNRINGIQPKMEDEVIQTSITLDNSHERRRVLRGNTVFHQWCSAVYLPKNPRLRESHTIPPSRLYDVDVWIDGEIKHTVGRCQPMGIVLVWNGDKWNTIPVGNGTWGDIYNHLRKETRYLEDENDTDCYFSRMGVGV